MTAGRVGRSHGHDGSFWVERPEAPLPPGTEVQVGGLRATVERRDGTDEKPLLRLSGLGDKDSVSALRGERITVAERDAPLAEGEWLVEDLIGCDVPGLGAVVGVIAGPSCDVLEVGDERVLVPLVSGAVRRVDVDARTIEVDRGFLGLDADGGAEA